MNRLNAADTRRALDLFREAAQRDPGFGRPLACASWCFRRVVQLQGLILNEDEIRECLALAEGALRVAPGDPYVLWQSGSSFAFISGELDHGRELTERSLDINPNSARAWLAQVCIQNLRGEPATAIASTNRAMRLSPVEVALWVAHGELAKSHFRFGAYGEAASWAWRSVEKHPDNLPAWLVLVAARAQLGETAEARAHLAHLKDLAPELRLSDLVARFRLDRLKNLDALAAGMRIAGLEE